MERLYEFATSRQQICHIVTGEMNAQRVGAVATAIISLEFGRVVK